MPTNDMPSPAGVGEIAVTRTRWLAEMADSSIKCKGIIGVSSKHYIANVITAMKLKNHTAQPPLCLCAVIEYRVATEGANQVAQWLITGEVNVDGLTVGDGFLHEV